MGICDNNSSRNENKNKTKLNVELVHEKTQGNIKSSIKQELMIGDNIPVPINIVNKAVKSICKITNKNMKKPISGTGFFMKISDNQKYLITNNHIISQNNINNNIKIEIFNKKIMKLKFNNRIIKYFAKPKDITLIEINEYDSIYNDIEFLDYDLNYKRGYMIYKEALVFSIHHPNGEEEEECVGGKIKNINGIEFHHSVSTQNGSSGCPIILLTKNINSILVIGIHKGFEDLKQLNIGTFIGEIFNNKNIINNFIIAEIDTKYDDINKDIRIINSYSNQTIEFDNIKLENESMNENETIKCDIRINDKLIPYTDFYKFNNTGNYIIKYTYKNSLSKINGLFSECYFLKHINLSNFITKNVTDMSFMFSDCYSVKYINISDIDTQNVNNMSCMFKGCSSLMNINLSDFNTQNVNDMSHMFEGCSSLTNLNLSKFNTEKVIDMSNMFNRCSSLTDINLSNFNTQHVINMYCMFLGCSSLKSLNLSNFYTDNAIYVDMMFEGCSSLININLLNFETKNIQDIHFMFRGCESLEIENIITKDDKILKQYFVDKEYN